VTGALSLIIQHQAKAKHREHNRERERFAPELLPETARVILGKKPSTLAQIAADREARRNAKVKDRGNTVPVKKKRREETR